MSFSGIKSVQFNQIVVQKCINYNNLLRSKYNKTKNQKWWAIKTKLKIQEKNKKTKQKFYDCVIIIDSFTKLDMLQCFHIFFLSFFPTNFVWYTTNLWSMCCVVFFFFVLNCKNHRLHNQIKCLKILHAIIKTIYSRNNAIHTAIPKRFLQLQSIIII